MFNLFISFVRELSANWKHFILHSYLGTVIFNSTENGFKSREMSDKMLWDYVAKNTQLQLACENII